MEWSVYWTSGLLLVGSALFEWRRRVLRHRARLRAKALEDLPVIEAHAAHLEPAFVELAEGEYLNRSKVSRYLASLDPSWRGRTELAIETARLLDVETLERWYAAQAICEDPDSLVAQLNDRFENERLTEERAHEEREGVPANERLTVQQHLAVIRDEDANLVNAGAGCGKTKTIVAKVRYLVRRGLARHGEILVLTYSKAMKKEIAERIEVQAGKGVAVHTFHSFGRSVIKGTMSSVTSPLAEQDSLLSDFVSDALRQQLLADETRRHFGHFWGANLFDVDPEQGAKTYDEYLRTVGPRALETLCRTKMKSHQEVQLANWMTMNGIHWEYERDYPYRDRKGGKHQPDFFLPEHDLWIEHFGIDENGRTAPYVDERAYHATIEWKREQHRRHGTRLLETYSHERKTPGGGLVEALRSKLASCEVSPRPLSESEVDRIVELAFRPNMPFVRLLKTFLSLCRDEDLDHDALRQLTRGPRDEAFLSIFDGVRSAYENTLEQAGKIDFSDMIRGANRLLKSSVVGHRFKYVMIDEFQDTTAARLRLALQIRSRLPDARLFCVGDDWQSIYRFQGTDVRMITNFEEHVGPSKRTDLETTFRLPAQLSELSQQFVRMNPAQLQKTVRSHRASNPEARPVRIHQHPPTEQGEASALKKCLAIIAKHAEPGDSCLILGRYNATDQFLAWMRREARHIGLSSVRHSTIHSAKGQESDWVVILGNEARRFPAESYDDPVLEMLLPETSGVEHAEERRLFYVALTRAKQGVFLLVPEGKPSCFVQELDTPAYSRFLASPNFVRPLICPECSGQTIWRKRNSNTGEEFYACSNRPGCQGRLPTCACGTPIELQNYPPGETISCTRCGQPATTCHTCGKGILVDRGDFFGCNRFWRHGCRGKRSKV